jgi:hypothetical protein
MRLQSRWLFVSHYEYVLFSGLLLQQDAIYLANIMFHAPHGIFQCSQVILVLVQNLDNLGHTLPALECHPFP